MPVILDPKHVDPYVLKGDRELPAPEPDQHPATYATSAAELLSGDHLRQLAALPVAELGEWIERENATRRKRRWVFRLGIPRPQHRAIIRDASRARDGAFKMGTWEYHSVRTSLRSMDADEGCELEPPAWDDTGLVPDHVLAVLNVEDTNELADRVADMLRAKADDLGN
jgi:hypothetical protein